MKDPQADAVRDVLGLIRLLYAAARLQGAEDHAAALEAAGHALFDCHKVMQRTGLGSIPHACSAERAAEVLGGLAHLADAGPLLEAARARVRAGTAR